MSLPKSEYDYYREIRLWRRYLGALKTCISSLVVGVRAAYVVGSAVSGRLTALSDIDVVIVLDRELQTSEEALLRERIWDCLEKQGVPWWYPFTIIIVDVEDYRLIFSKARRIRIL